MDTTSSIKQKNTRQILVGDVPVGGNAPITVQSMTTTKPLMWMRHCSRFIH
ncbi:MAG: hypothetical protein CM15mP49_27410 [Actinomycetota bacterium]|nr:MAG: hypothetical protein CM15mP49_27410 [Actinomycetota bacterium]